jgi:hypothetical protein
MLYTAEKIGAVAPEQYGSCKHMLAVDQSLNKARSPLTFGGNIDSVELFVLMMLNHVTIG